ncbi:MAG: chemotaxis-specific protein-glutamate methyltransferase CheB [Bdellovibrionota bacterium]
MSGLGRIRVLVVDDSAVFRKFWSRALQNEPEIEVVGQAEDGLLAVEFLRANPVDIAILDLEMPRLDGLGAIPRMLTVNPGLRIIIASALTTPGSQAAIEALSIGASDYITKPSAQVGADSGERVVQDLVSKIHALRSRWPSAAPLLLRARAPRPFPNFPPRAIVIGSSTGGPAALGKLLHDLPSHVHTPILITQHMPPYFLQALAERLSKDSDRRCSLAVHGELVLPRRVYLAPGDHHLQLSGSSRELRISLNQSEPENFCRPAVDPLFASAAIHLGAGVLAVVLTGMGEDGRRGSERIVEAGGVVLAQDEASSVVWGMPGAVAKAGLASQVLALEEIGPFIGGIFLQRATVKG